MIECMDNFKGHARQTSQQHPQTLRLLKQMIWSESNIIFAIIGMVGLFSTAVIWQRANRITGRYYGKK